METGAGPSFLRGTPAFGPASFYREALGIVVPVMLQMVITSLISLIDNFMVSGLGDVKMAAVNVANQINFFYIVVVNASCMAGGIYLSQHRGASDARGMRQSLRFKLIAALGVAVVHSCLCLFVPETLIGLMLGGNDQKAVIVAQGARFLRLATPSLAPFAVAAAVASSYRDIGSTKAPLVVSSAAAAFCTGLNWILIYGMLRLPRLEVGGAAIATDLARLAEAATFLAFVAARRPAFAFRPREIFRIDAKLFGKIVRRSAMMLFSETAWVLSETIITATSVLVGSTLGAGKLEEARQKGRWILYGSIAFGAIVGALAAASTFLIPLVFGRLSDDARRVATGLVIVIASYIPLWTLLNAQFALSRSGGDTAMGVWVDVGVTYVVFLPIAFGLAWWTSLGPVALFAIAKLSDLGKAATAFWWLAKEKWVRNLADKGATLE